MSRLINAEEIKFVSDDDHYDFAYKSDIDALPTIEAEPVVHAHWSEMSGGLLADKLYTCSNCEIVALNSSKYCPNCGAKMDESITY